MMLTIYLIMMFISALIISLILEFAIGLNAAVTLLAMIVVGVTVLNVQYYQVHFQQDKNNSE